MELKRRRIDGVDDVATLGSTPCRERIEDESVPTVLYFTATWCAKTFPLFCSPGWIRSRMRSQKKRYHREEGHNNQTEKFNAMSQAANYREILGFFSRINTC
ncbi:hypothetical protein V6N12_070871 [Hibiscus sabdariffa]|uniref:Uncharacterized protein n=1 Tax=Hibiscus sabdariffa TaxID=183260 RepID=A0ABR2FI44_9ROSI